MSYVKLCTGFCTCLVYLHPSGMQLRSRPHRRCSSPTAPFCLNSITFRYKIGRVASWIHLQVMLNEARDPKLDDAARCSEISTTSSDGRVAREGVSGRGSGDPEVDDMLSSHMAFQAYGQASCHADKIICWSSATSTFSCMNMGVTQQTSSSHVTVAR